MTVSVTSDGGSLLDLVRPGKPGAIARPGPNVKPGEEYAWTVPVPIPHVFPPIHFKLTALLGIDLGLTGTNSTSARLVSNPLDIRIPY
jgi:hypothetical protein